MNSPKELSNDIQSAISHLKNLRHQHLEEFRRKKLGKVFISRGRALEIVGARYAHQNLEDFTIKLVCRPVLGTSRELKLLTHSEVIEFIDLSTAGRTVTKTYRGKAALAIAEDSEDDEGYLTVSGEPLAKLLERGSDCYGKYVSVKTWESYSKPEPGEKGCLIGSHDGRMNSIFELYQSDDFDYLWTKEEVYVEGQELIDFWKSSARLGYWLHIEVTYSKVQFSVG